MNIEKLIHDLRARINPQYYDQIGTESYERNQCVMALEYLREENERQRFDILAMNQSLDLMREENERLRKDAYRNAPIIRAAAWYLNNPDSPKSALNHIRNAIDAARGGK